MRFVVPVDEFEAYRIDCFNSEPENIPYFHDSMYDKRFFTIEKEIHEWMIEYSIEYRFIINHNAKIKYDDPWMFIEIDDPKKAVIYKLTWC